MSRRARAATRGRRWRITIRGSGTSSGCGRSPTGLPRDRGTRQVETGDAYKDQVQNQWNNNPVGSETARSAQPHTLEWFLEVERYRYGVYAPWMPEVMEFAGHAGRAGARGRRRHGNRPRAVREARRDRHRRRSVRGAPAACAQENFRLRGLTGRFVHHDAETLPFDDDTFDLVYSNGVLHHTPNTAQAVAEMLRVLKPGGRAIVMVYAENSLQYWRNLVWHYGMKSGDLASRSMAEIMSRTVERRATMPARS